MIITRRAAFGALAAPVIAAPALLGMSKRAHAATRTLKVSHQFPVSDGDKGDFRDRLVRRFAKEVEARTDGSLKFEIYPNSSLVKTFAQFNALKKGAIDFTLYPTTYSGGEIPELNLTFMPAIVTSYDQAYKWKNAEIGREMTRLIEAKGVKIVSWLWQSGGIASRGKPLIRPADAAGIKIRGGSREMDMMFKAAGATTANMPSNEIYVAMQTGAIDAAATSSTSLLSFKLEELSKNLTSAKGKSFFFIFEPILMSSQTYDALTPEQQKAIMAVGEALEPVGREGSLSDDDTLVEVYRKAGVTVEQIDDASLDAWKKIAAESAWKDFASRSPDAARFLDMAQKV